MSRPHILVLVPFYPDGKNLFHGRFFRERADALSKRFQVTVLHPVIHPFSATRSLASSLTITENGPDFREIHVATPVLAQRVKLLNATALLHSLKRGFEQTVRTFGSPDFIFAETGFPSGDLAFRLSRRTGIPFGICDHYSFSPSMFIEHRKRWPEVYKAARFSAAVSPALQRVIRASTEFRFPVYVLPNCLAESLLSRPVTSVPKEQNFRWLFVGRDHPVKDPDLLFRAFSRLPAHHTLSIVGLDSGEKFSQSVDAAARQRITFLPNMAAGRLFEEMEQHHALICTSRIETFGMAPLEMLALGRMACTTPCGGPEQFVHDQNGGVAAGFDPASIAEAMLETERRFTQFDTRTTAFHVRNRFSPDNFVQTFSRLSCLSFE